MPIFSRDAASTDPWLAEAFTADQAASGSFTMPSTEACEDLLCMETNDPLPEIPALEPSNSMIAPALVPAPAAAAVAPTSVATASRSSVRITNPKGEVVNLKDLIEASKNKKILEERMLSSAVFVPAGPTTTTPSEAINSLTNEASFEKAAKKLENALLAHQGEWETTWRPASTMEHFIVALDDKFPGSDEQLKKWVIETVIAVDAARGYPHQRNRAESLIKSAKKTKKT
ncbi:hypothetical protein F5Y18DRAFT_425215 [Xylariaceae sp. FL1019]|nr:hypothetical protein F5Y18DRAFT_425215 [Xylariaceae sp. FL1019]